MLAPSYLPSVGINKLVYERVYGSNKTMNVSQSSSNGDASLTGRSSCSHRHGNPPKHTRHRKSRDQVTRLQQESLMNLSTHSDTCIHTPSTIFLRNDRLLRPSSVPHDMEKPSSRDHHNKSPDSSTSDEREFEDSIILSGEFSVRYLLND